MRTHRWSVDDYGTMVGTDGRWRVVAVNDGGDLTVEHEPSGEVDTVPAGWLLPESGTV